MVILPLTMSSEYGTGGEAGTGGVNDGGDDSAVLGPAVVAAGVISSASSFVGEQFVGGVIKHGQTPGEDCADVSTSFSGLVATSSSKSHTCKARRGWSTTGDVEHKAGLP